jgi:homoserine O-succinyltransferase
VSIVLPLGLPARETLTAEGVDVLTKDDLHGRAGRPLRICLINLMPKKVATETQFARLLGAASIPVELTLCLPDSYRTKSTPAAHLAAFYRPWSEIRRESFDGLVVTGAPIETLPFEQVTYWPELCAIYDWAKAQIGHSLYICWAAQGALNHFRAVPKHPMPAKLSGVYQHRVASAGSYLLKGIADAFPVPVSRHTEVRAADLPASAGLTVLAQSPDAGLCLVEDRENRAVYMFNHLEYDTGTLRDEFLRDRGAGLPAAIPVNYFPGDDPGCAPVNAWRPAAHLLFGNWLEEIQRAEHAHTTDRPTAVDVRRQLARSHENLLMRRQFG